MKHSSGIIPFRINEDDTVEFFVGHPGENHDYGKEVWYFLKGGVEEGESYSEAAIREFKEETGLSMEDCSSGMLIPLGTVQQSGHKTATAFGLHYPNIDPTKCKSNLCEDGVTPEIDRYCWMPYERLRAVTHPTHLIFYKQLLEMCANC